MQQHLPKLTNLCQHHHSEQQFMGGASHEHRCKVGQIVVVVHGIGEKFAQRSRGPSWWGKIALAPRCLYRYGSHGPLSSRKSGFKLVITDMVLWNVAQPPSLWLVEAPSCWSNLHSCCLWIKSSSMPAKASFLIQNLNGVCLWWLHVVFFWSWSLTPGQRVNWLINLSSSLFIHVCWLTCPNSFCLHPFSNMITVTIHVLWTKLINRHKTDQFCW